MESSNPCEPCEFCKKNTQNEYCCNFFIDKECKTFYCSERCLYVDYNHFKKHILSCARLKGNFIKNSNGITNQGNKCYMISGLQCLSICRLFSLYMISNEYKKDKINDDGLLCDEIANIFNEMYSEKDGDNKLTINISNFIESIGKYEKKYKDRSQEDSNLFITDFLTFLSDELNNRKITYFFIGEMIKKTECNCESILSKPDEFKSLFIPPKINKGILCYSAEKKKIFQYDIFDKDEELTIKEINERMETRFSKNISNLHYYRQDKSFLKELKDKNTKYSQKDFLSTSKQQIRVYEYEKKKDFIVVFVRFFIEVKSEKGEKKPIDKYPACFLMNKYYRVQTIFDEINATFHNRDIGNNFNIFFILNKSNWNILSNENLENNYLSKTFEEIINTDYNYCFICLKTSEKSYFQKLKKLFFSINIPLEILLHCYFSPRTTKISKNNELIDKRCPKCNELLLTKSIITRLPYYLIITILVNKINRDDYPYSGMIQDKIILENYIDESLKPQKDFCYKLIAINVHQGTNNSGHYKAQILNKGKWYLYDDSRCQEIREDERKEGVIYIYQREPTPSQIKK